MDKFNSRKYKLAKWIIMISTFLTFMPPIITVWFLPTPLIILTGTEYVSILSATLLFYNGSNIFEKHLDNKANSTVEEITEIEENTEEQK